MYVLRLMLCVMLFSAVCMVALMPPWQNKVYTLYLYTLLLYSDRTIEKRRCGFNKFE